MRLLVTLFSSLALCAMVGVVVVLLALNHYSADLPDHKALQNYDPPLVTRLHAGDGRLMEELASEKRVYVPFSALPRRVIDAFVAAEDQNFWKHPGFDTVGIVRAAIASVKSKFGEGSVQGASTITQQVAKNFFLTKEQSLERKMKELLLAMRIERTYSKERIIELYVNEIFFGNRSYGVAAAALNYFNKPLDELTIGETAFLAGLPKAPSNYHPVNNHDAAVARRNYVIGRMEAEKYITAEEATAARAEPLTMRKRDEEQIYRAPYFAEEVRRLLTQQYGERAYQGGLSVRTTVDPRLQDLATRSLREGLMAYDRRHGWRGPVAHLDGLEDWAAKLGKIAKPAGAETWRMGVVFELKAAEAIVGFDDGSGGRIPLSELDWARKYVSDSARGPAIKKPGDVLSVGDVVLVESVTENAAGKALPKGSYALRQIPEVQGGMIAMDPNTGRVLALVGGFSREMSDFNRATQALRQPGSSFKPFVYLAALEHGQTPTTIVYDTPITLSQGAGLDVWQPENYSGKSGGPMPLRQGIEQSRNLMTVRLAQTLGAPMIQDYAKKFGIIDNPPPYLSLALGAGETTVERMAGAYSMLANGGKRVTPTLIDRIQDRHGKTIYRHDTDEWQCQGCGADLAWTPGLAHPTLEDKRAQVADPRNAYQMVSMLEGVIQRGTGRRIAELNRSLAGKTGTTNDSMDVWFTGFSADLVVGVYMGFDKPRSLGPKETGGNNCVPIFKAFMAEALDGKPDVPFSIPDGIRLMRIDPATGRVGGGPGTIEEAFLKGSEPSYTSMPAALAEPNFGEATPAQLFGPAGARGAAPMANPYLQQGAQPYRWQQQTPNTRYQAPVRTQGGGGMTGTGGLY